MASSGAAAAPTRRPAAARRGRATAAAAGGAPTPAAIATTPGRSPLDPDDPDRWWVSAASGPWRAHGGHDTRARIYRWDGAWEATTGDLDAFPYALLMRGGVLYAGLGDGRLLSSPDGGDTWTELALDGDRPARISALAA